MATLLKPVESELLCKEMISRSTSLLLIEFEMQESGEAVLQYLPQAL